MTFIYQVIADGKIIGVTVAANESTALAASISGTSRKTDSKCGTECDYTAIQVILLDVGSGLNEAKRAIKNAIVNVANHSKELQPLR